MIPAALALIALTSSPVTVVSETRPAFASLATVSVAVRDPGQAGPAIEGAFAVFAGVDESMNEWRPGSPLDRLNAGAGRGWVSLPADLCDALALARDGAVRTGGRFDPTWAALRDLWRFDQPDPRPPADSEVRRRCRLVGHRGLSLRPRPQGGCEARLARAGMKVGLGGLAKGWALDEAARVLRARGHEDFLLQAGGDLYAAGSRGDGPWVVQVRDPLRGPLDSLASIAVRDRALSTSGDYEHGYDAGGKRQHHVIDPRTCRPAPGARSVTVLARTAVEAEILGKALFVEGGAASLSLARAAGVEAIVVDAEGALHATEGLRGSLSR
jgi:thiamine biosynthesis lipoprotein